MTNRTSSNSGPAWLLVLLLFVVALVFGLALLAKQDTIKDLREQTSSSRADSLQAELTQAKADLQNYRNQANLAASNSKAQSDRAIQLENEIHALLVKATNGVPAGQQEAIKLELATKIFSYGSYVTRNAGDLVSGATPRPALDDGREIPDWVYGDANHLHVKKCVTDGVAAICAERVRR